MDVDTAAARLYALPPVEFTAERGKLVRQTKADGDAEAARQIGALRRPTTAAWAANLLAREDPAAVSALLELGASLADAQQARDGTALRELAARRRTQLEALVRTALRLVDRAGESARDALPTELRETLSAALGDENVAGALRAGRLTTSHQPTAVGFGDAATVFAADPPGAGGRPPRKAAATKDRSHAKTRTGIATRQAQPSKTPPPGPSKTQPSTTQPSGPSKARQTRPDKQGRSSSGSTQQAAAARRRRDEAAAAVEQAEQALRAAEDELVAGRQELDRADERLAGLDEERRQARAAQVELRKTLHRKEKSVDRCKKEVRAAQAAVSSAERSVRTGR